MKCFYHKADWDGVLSAAILSSRYPKAELIGIDYGDDDITYEKGEKVFMLDFSLQPYNRMIKLSEETSLTWIDHHISTVEFLKGKSIKGDITVVNGTAACELTWHYLYKEGLPHVVDLIARYDIGDWDDEVLDFQYGMRMFPLDPLYPSLSLLLFSENSEWMINEISKAGISILNYIRQENKKLCKDVVEVELDGKLFLALNIPNGSSLTFESIYEPRKYNGTISFWYKNNKWVVSLRSTTDDMSKIAKKYGGGGHAAAAGFQCKKLPFIEI